MLYLQIILVEAGDLAITIKRGKLLYLVTPNFLCSLFELVGHMFISPLSIYNQSCTAYVEILV